MNPKHVTRKLIGSEDERAVSPVIGVILMVAITVILAAVIATFVLDMGQSVDQEAQAGVTMQVSEGDEQVQVEVVSMGNAEYVDLHTNEWGHNATNITTNNLSVGDSVTLMNGSAENDEWHINESGSISAVAVVNESGMETSVASESWDFDNSES